LALEAVAQESQTADDGKKGGQVSDKEGEKEKKSGRFYKRQFRK
jgi:hypothetical protein